VILEQTPKNPVFACAVGFVFSTLVLFSMYTPVDKLCFSTPNLQYIQRLHQFEVPYTFCLEKNVGYFLVYHLKSLYNW